jgi:hypothetical protein
LVISLILSKVVKLFKNDDDIGDARRGEEFNLWTRKEGESEIWRCLEERTVGWGDLGMNLKRLRGQSSD